MPEELREQELAGKRLTGGAVRNPYDLLSACGMRLSHRRTSSDVLRFAGWTAVRALTYALAGPSVG